MPVREGELMELQPVDEIIDRHRAEPSALIQVLLDIQKEMSWLSRGA